MFNTSLECDRHIELFMIASFSFQDQIDNIIRKVDERVRDSQDLWPGTFTQCLAVGRSTEETKDVGFRGQYCRAFFLPSSLQKMTYEEYLLTKGEKPIFYLPKSIPQTGICIPSTCTPNDVKRLFEIYMKQSFRKWTVTVIDKYCQMEKDIPISAATVLVALVIVTLVGFVVAGTTFEILDLRNARRLRRSRALERQQPANDEATLSTENSSVSNRVEAEQIVKTRLKTYGACSVEVLKAFSAYSNIRDLFNVHVPSSQIKSFNGIRLFGLISTIVAHTFVLSFPHYWKQLDKMDDFTKRFTTQGILHFSVCLDGIILISGVLYAMITLKKLQDLHEKFNILQFYMHRLWRLYPAYIFNIAIIVGILPYCGSGPWWPDMNYAIECCEKNWWTNLLFINNIVHVENMCQLHFWYSAVDFQLFLISPILIIAFHRRPVIGWCVVICLTLISISALAYKAYADLLNPRDIFKDGISVYNLERYMYEIYFLPVSHLGSFCVGISLGYYLHTRGTEFTINRICHWGGLLFAMIFITSPIWLFALFYSNPPGASLEEATVCESLSRIVWVLALAFLVICFQSKIKDYITKVLRILTSLPCYVITARLQYSVYILHFNLLQIYFATIQRPTAFSGIQVAKIVATVFLVSHLLAIPYTLLSELPFIKLEKLIERKLAKRKDRHVA